MDGNDGASYLTVLTFGIHNCTGPDYRGTGDPIVALLHYRARDDTRSVTLRRVNPPRARGAWCETKAG